MAMMRGRCARWALALGLAGTMALGACDEGSEGSQTAQIEVAGAWTTPFSDQAETISDAAWGTPDFMVDVVSFDNAANFAVTRNLATADYAPGKFNKNIWSEPSQAGFYYCTVAFGLDTAAAAEAADDSVADANDLAGAGCGGFPWTHLTK